MIANKTVKLCTYNMEIVHEKNGFIFSFKNQLHNDFIRLLIWLAMISSIYYMLTTSWINFIDVYIY